MRGIDRRSPLPYYYQLKEIILADIAERGLRPGDRVPGDHELIEAYDVSRTVVRQALSELETEGVLERVKGRGTFVAPERTGEALVQTLTGLYEDVRARGSQLVSQVRRLEVVPADERVAAGLELEVGAPVIVLERLRYVDDEPWVLVVTHLPESVAPDLVHEDLSDKSLYELLEHKYHVALRSGRRSVQAGIAHRSLASHLGIAEGDPVLVLRSTVYGDAGPVEMFIAYHRGDRSSFEVTLTRGEDHKDIHPLMHLTEPHQ